MTDEPVEPSAADVIARLHVLIAEALRCLDAGRADATRGKLAYADYLLRELAAKRPTPGAAAGA